MKYTTQMNAARQGIVTKEMEAVAAYEGIDVKDLMAEVAAGTIVIPANKNHKCLKPFGIGNSLKTDVYKRQVLLLSESLLQFLMLESSMEFRHWLDRSKEILWQRQIGMLFTPTQVMRIK